MEESSLFNFERPITSLSSEIIFEVAGFPVANSTLTVLLILILFGVGGFFVVRKWGIKPRGRVQMAVEMIFEEVKKLVDQITNSDKHTRIIFPLVGALLVYLLVANLIGLIPGLTSIMYNGEALFRSPTSDFSTTLGLALAAVVVIQFISLKEWGIFGHIGKYLPIKHVVRSFKEGIGKGVISLIDLFVGLLDIIGEIAKVVSLSLRLFGNMYAGEVLMIILFGAIAYIVPSLWFAMNLFVGILQAMVFAALVGAYYMLAVKPEDPNPL